MTELKGYAMMQFSYMLLKTYGKGETNCPARDINDRCVCKQPFYDVKAFSIDLS